MGKQISLTVTPELLKRFNDAKSKREKVNAFGTTSRSKYLTYLVEKGLELEEKELEKNEGESE